MTGISRPGLWLIGAILAALILTGLLLWERYGLPVALLTAFQMC